MSWLDTLEAIRSKDFSKAPDSERDKAARDVINMCSYATAVVAVSPIPFSDAVLMLPIQSAMVMTIGHIFGRKVTSADAKDLMLELGATAGVGFLARQGIKAILPVFGALLTIPAAFAATWGIGRVAMEYFRNPNTSKDQLNSIYDRAKKEASGLFSKEAFDNFRKKNEASIHKVAEAEDSEEEPASKKKPAKKKAPPKKKAAELTPASIIEEMIPEKLAKKKNIAKKINGRVHLDIAGPSGGKWTVDFTKGSNWVKKGHSGDAKMTVSCTDELFIQVATGKKSATSAVMMGGLSLEPMDFELAGAIGELFS